MEENDDDERDGWKWKFFFNNDNYFIRGNIYVNIPFFFIIFSVILNYIIVIILKLARLFDSIIQFFRLKIKPNICV